MELLPISASLGAMGSLPAKLDALRDTKLKKEISKLRIRLLQLSKVRDPSQAARSWMEDVRQLSYDMENFIDTETDWIAKMRRIFKVRVKESNICYDKYRLERVFPTIDHRLPTVEGGRKTDPVVVGLHEEGGVFDRLCSLLTDGDEQRKVLSIVGVGGIGKTTLAKELWRKHKPGDYFQCRAFVRTAKKPDMRRMFRSILAQVRPHQPPDASEVHELIHDLREHLRNKRYFIVIDDVWATSVWDVARRAFPEDNGSRILTTTEIENVALACCSYQLDYIFDMQPLGLSHSKELFTNGLNEMPADEIIRRCGGLPLAIISISSVIASQGEANTIQNKEEVQNILPTNTTPDDILKQVLIFCYNSLPSGLQTCLLYLSLYPENYIILKEDMMKQWVAEGFILASAENEKMKVAGNFFDKLVDMGMIQHIDVEYSDEVLDYNDEVLYYAVHPTVHDLITAKSVEENFVTVIDYSQGRVRLSSKVSRLSLQFGSATNATTPESIGLSHVRSLAFIGLESCFPPISEFKLLRFLTLHMWADQPSTGVDLKPTSELVLLRSLQVTCNGTVHLPDLMQGPIHLETLEINARVAAIPANIVHLRSWLHLRLGVGTELPDVTGILKNATLNPPISLDDSSSPADSVKTINLLSPISRIPQWFRQLTNLCILKLVVRELQPDGIINLQGLPFLAVLSLHVQRRPRELIDFATGAFTALEYFGFRCGVLRLAFKKGAMPNLQRVKLGFNAHRGEQYDCFLVGVKDMLSIQKISVLIGSAAGAEETDLKSAESAFKEAIGRHYSTASIKRADMVEEEFDQPEQQHSIQEQHPSTPSEHPAGRKEYQVNILDIEKHLILFHAKKEEKEKHLILGEHPSASTEQPQDVRGPQEKQHSIRGNQPSTPSEQPRVPKQDPPEQQHSVRGQHPSASSEQPQVAKQDSEIEIKQDSETEIKQDSETEIINRLTSPVSLSKNNDYSRIQQPEATPCKDEHLSKKERPMPDMAVGLTKSVVEGALRKVQAAIDEETKLRQSAQRDLVFITVEFEMMFSFLNNAKSEHVENLVVRAWVQQVRELAYDVEDCIELVIQGYVKDKTSVWFRVWRGCLPWAPASALDQAVEEIEQLKARVQDVSSWKTRYSRITDSSTGYDGDGDRGEKTAVEDSSDVGSTLKIEGSQDYVGKDEKLALSQVTQNSSYGETPSSNSEAATSWMITNPLSGRNSELIELRSYTAKARFSNSRVISVWGIAGIGKSALVRNLYYDRMVNTSQFNKYRWVDVSRPFNLRDFARSLLLDSHSEKNPIKECHEFLRQHQCLVVIDDVQSKEEWDLIQTALVSRDSASVIIVITTEDSMATYCTNIEEQVFNVKGLQAAAAFDLFRKEANKKPSSSLNGFKDVELDELILKCGGLPKVIVVLAAFLATQSVMLMDTVRSLNHRFIHFLENSPEFDSLQGLFGWMHSFLRDCPDSLKPCIFYLSIFPPNQNIRHRRLVRRWIAEGYTRDSYEISAEEKGVELFSNLLQLSIIQQLPHLVSTAFNDTRMVSCQVNGFIREYIVSRRMEENLVFELGSNCVVTTQRTGRHLVILKSWDRDRIVFESIDFSRLRSLTVFGKWESFFISTSMRLLRVLDLEDTLGVNDADLKNMVQQLRHLKFLSLRGCSEIFHLPSSLGDLRQLQTLDVRHTSIVTLPASITKLQNLQYIRAGTTVPPSTMSASSNQLRKFRRHRSLVGVHVPRGIGKLTVLHTLGVVNVGSSGGKAVVEGLKKLTHLRKLGVSGINKHNSKDFMFATSGHVHLESLSMRLDKDSKDCLDDLCLPWENLRSLTLYGLQDMLPLRTPLRKLSKLDLEMDNLQQNGMEFLAKLPELRILHLGVEQLEDGKLHFHSQICGLELHTFEKVKILEVTCRSSRLHVTFGSKSMKKLELLKIDCSSALYQLTGLNDVPELKEVLLKGTDDEAAKTYLESQLANHPKKPIVKLASTFVLKD